MEIEIASVIKDIGFPAAIALYALITLNKSMKENTAMVKENTRVLSILCTKIGCDDMLRDSPVNAKNET